MAVSVLCLFIAVPYVGLWSMIVAFPGHPELLFADIAVDAANAHSCKTDRAWETHLNSAGGPDL